MYLAVFRIISVNLRRIISDLRKELPERILLYSPGPSCILTSWVQYEIMLMILSGFLVMGRQLEGIIIIVGCFYKM